MLDPWPAEATKSGMPGLRTIAEGIRHDRASVLATLTYEWSQGRGGQIYRLKLLKGQSYGHARFDLLRHRVLARSD